MLIIHQRLSKFYKYILSWIAVVTVIVEQKGECIMPNESSEIGSGFVKIFYGILLALAICTGIYAIVTPLVAANGFFDTSLNGVLNQIMTEINGLLGLTP